MLLAPIGIKKIPNAYCCKHTPTRWLVVQMSLALPAELQTFLLRFVWPYFATPINAVGEFRGAKG
jgi:hypothetical protein